MDKHQIADVLYDAIIEISPFAADLLASPDQLFDRDKFFVNLGINSIDYAQIANLVIKKLNIDCTLDVFTRTNNVKAVVDLLHQFTLTPAKSDVATPG